MSFSTRLLFGLVLSTSVGFQSACQLTAGAHSAKRLPLFNSTTPPPSSSSSKPLAPKSAPEIDAYEKVVAKQWFERNYDWIDIEAARLRVSKERFPGGYWKLRALFRTLESPVYEDDSNFEAHIAKLEQWSKSHPKSITPRILLAEVWQNYAWKARGNGYSNTVTDEGWDKFRSRIEKASKLLTQSFRPQEKCPEWYLAALIVAKAEGWERNQMEEVFAEGAVLEPTYYYLHQAKAAYLLPRWFGEEGDWEEFAEQAADRIGGEQGDILFFAIYSNMMSYHSIDFMNTHQKHAGRLVSGFRAIEKLYGSSPQRLNEAALFSFFAGDPKTTDELMKRIGDDFDESVWRSKTNFDVFKHSAAQMLKRNEVQQKSQ